MILIIMWLHHTVRVIIIIMFTVIYTRFMNQGLRVRRADTVILIPALIKLIGLPLLTGFVN